MATPGPVYTTGTPAPPPIVMPRRYTGKRKRTIRKPRRVARKRTVSRANLRNDIYYFRRWIRNPETIVGNATYNPYISAYAFTFNQLVNVGEFTSLFDQYMITRIQVRWFLRIDPSAQTAATASYPRHYCFKDWDDSGLPIDLNAFREHSKCQVRVMHPNRPIVVTYKPAVLIQLYETLTNAAYGPKWRQWIDCNDPDVPHYGLKWAIDDLTNTNYRVTTEVRYWFKMRGAR